jgi:hypothetical protein
VGIDVFHDQQAAFWINQRSKFAPFTVLERNEPR